MCHCAPISPLDPLSYLILVSSLPHSSSLLLFCGYFAASQRDRTARDLFVNELLLAVIYTHTHTHTQIYAMAFTASAASRTTPPSKLPALGSRPASRVRTAASAAGGATPPRETTSHGRLGRSAAATGTTTTNASSAAGAVVLFSELPDQLLCSPDNSIWVYGQYALSFFASEATALAKLETKLAAMMREAHRLYEVSRLYFLSLSAAEQRAEVLRCASASGGGGGGGNAAAHLARAVEALQMEEGVYQALREGWPSAISSATRGGADVPMQEEGGWKEAAGAAATSLSADAAEAQTNDDEAADGVVRYAAGLRVNLVLDIIASRKTLGADPLHSRAYRIAEALYRRVLAPPPAAAAVPLGLRIRPRLSRGEGEGGAHVDPLRAAAPHVRSFVIGVSDTGVTLVGRDVVCPYRHVATLSTLQQRMRSALEGLAEAQQRPASSFVSAAVAGGGGSPIAAQHTSASGAAQDDGAGEAAYMLASMVARQVQSRHSTDSLLPGPYTRVAPVLLGQVDQTRLILCAPPVDWTSVEGA